MSILKQIEGEVSALLQYDMLEFVPCLRPYCSYCLELSFVKSLLELTFRHLDIVLGTDLCYQGRAL